MTLPDFRMAVGLTAAHRSTRAFPVPKPSNAAAKLGLQYENKVGKQLQDHVRRDRFTRLEHNPWFTFFDTYGMANCSPDYLLWMDDRVIIIEVKLSWVEVALPKLIELYCPVVSVALHCSVMPLVIVRYTNPKAPTAKFSLSEAILDPHKLLHWPSNGPIPW